MTYINKLSVNQFTKNGYPFPVRLTDKIVGARNGVICIEDNRDVRKFYEVTPLGEVGKLIKKKWINTKHFLQGHMSKSIAVNEYRRYPDGINITKQTTRYFDEDGYLVSKHVYKQLQNDPRHIQNTIWDYLNCTYRRKTNKPALNGNHITTFIDKGRINFDGSVSIFEKRIKNYN